MADDSDRRAELADELKRRGREIMLSNHTMQLYADKATVEQMELLVQMMDEEVSYRDENRRRRLIKRAAFPVPKTFEGYDWTQVKVPTGLTREEIEGCDFIADSRNLVLFGPVGTGKTHMSTAIGMRACEMGLSVRFFTTSELVLRLSSAKEEGTLERMMTGIRKSDLIILDEFGYVPIDRDGARLLFQIISDSYETRSIIITTNVEFSRWGTVLTDDQMAAAIIDRIAHHGHLLVFEGESYRMKHALMRQQYV